VSGQPATKFLFKSKYEFKLSWKCYKSPMFYSRIIQRSGFTDIECLFFESLKDISYKKDEGLVVQYPVEGRMFVLDFCICQGKRETLSATGKFGMKNAKRLGKTKSGMNF